jgi:hypothetical protein
VDFDASKVAEKLLFDFNWVVRKALAESLPRLNVDQAHFLNELL